MTWGNPQSALEKAIATSLWPVSAAYGLAAYARLRAYGAGWLTQHTLPVPVLSVGNITCGGTGKTPVTVDLARHLIAAGRRVAILSRGYKRRSTDEIVIVGDGRGRIAPAADAGDEPHMMAQAVPEAVVIVGAARRVTGEIAVRVYDCDFVILDDGFQHLSVIRDSDVVLIDYYDEPGNDRLIPAGRLREPLAALARADWLVISRLPERPDPEKLARLNELARNRAPQAGLTSCRFVPAALCGLASSERLPTSSLSGARVFAVAGIARPQAFFRQLADLGATVAGTRCFPDHHWYTPGDLLGLARQFKSCRADIMVTTAKDAARLPAEFASKLPVHILELETKWLGPLPLPQLNLCDNNPSPEAGQAAKSCRAAGT
ncbi:MAG TPA: tetraacyldisaccharide 4'-kinase [Candidatus Obscuribacterales bacterium]